MSVAPAGRGACRRLQQEHEQWTWFPAGVRDTERLVRVDEALLSLQEKSQWPSTFIGKCLSCWTRGTEAKEENKTSYSELKAELYGEHSLTQLQEELRTSHERKKQETVNEPTGNKPGWKMCDRVKYLFNDASFTLQDFQTSDSGVSSETRQHDAVTLADITWNVGGKQSLQSGEACHPNTCRHVHPAPSNATRPAKPSL